MSPEARPRQRPEFSHALASVRLLDPPSTLGWHPVSQEELGERAMQLAQQMLATRDAPSSCEALSHSSTLG
jgi:hypothetical protein